MTFQIKLAERIIEIHALYEKTYSFCEKYKVCDQSGAPPDLVVNITQQDIEKEQMELQREVAEKRTENTLEYNPEFIERLILLKKIAVFMLRYDTLLLHGVTIYTKGLGYIITAPSGVGKTTRALLWMDNIPRSLVVNGDKPLIRITEDKVYAYGTPWSGKEKWDFNISVPVRAIFLLERADQKGELSVEEVNIENAIGFLLQQTYQEEDPAFTQRVIQLLYSMKDKVKFFRFRSEPTVEAVKLAYEMARVK